MFEAFAWVGVGVADRKPTQHFGSPITNERPGPNGGRYTKLEGGVIYWTPQTGAHVASGAIRIAWEHQYGGAAGPLGYPTTITNINGQPQIQNQS